MQHINASWEPGDYEIPVFAWSEGVLQNGTVSPMRVDSWGNVEMPIFQIPGPVEYLVFEFPDRCLMVDVGEHHVDTPDKTLNFEVSPTPSFGNKSYFEECRRAEVEDQKKFEVDGIDLTRFVENWPTDE